jgi:ubiquinone/menaquinone biosynthesis C-methylase UbiE
LINEVFQFLRAGGFACTFLILLRVGPNAHPTKLVLLDIARRFSIFRSGGFSVEKGSTMTNADQQFVGSIPGNYDRYMRPLIFEPYAQDLAARVGKLNHQSILETAAGTGVVTAAISKILSPGDTLIATDLNPAMLAVAKAAITNPAISFQQADATALPFPNESFDVVVCQFGIMFFPDKLVGCKEAFRVLRKGGTFLFNVWDTLQFNELPAIVSATVASMFPNNPPDFMARTPHGYNDIEGIKKTLGAAGFQNVASHTLPKRSRAPSAHEPAMGYCHGTPMRSEIEARDAGKLELATEQSTKAIAAKFGNGPIDASIQAIVFTARRA